MKKLMFAMVAALSFAVVAQDAPGAKPEGDAGVRRPPRERVASTGGVMGDPAVMAVMNPRLAEKIGLPPETREQIRKIDQDTREQIRALRAKQVSAVKALLTPEQLAKANEEMKAFRDARRGGNRRVKAGVKAGGDKPACEKPDGDKPLPPPPPAK